MLPLSTVEGEDTEEVKTKPPEKGALLSENTDDPPKKPSRMKGRMSLKILPFCPLGGDAATPPGEDEEGPDVPIVQQIKWAITLGSYSDLLLCKSQHCGRCFILPSFCFTYYLEPDDSDSDSETAPEPLKPDSNCTVIPIVGLDFKEIKVCECPLCCLTFFSAS